MKNQAGAVFIFEDGADYADPILADLPCDAGSSETSLMVFNATSRGDPVG
jgi:hypothetical protein